MIKNSFKKRLFLILSSLFIIIVIYLFPTKNENIKVNEKYNKTKEVIIYLLDENKYVSRVTVYLKEEDKIKKIKEIINYLTISSKNSNYIKEGFTPIIPENTKLLSLDINNDLVKLNFSKEILNIPKENEEKLISSIIYSLTSINNINKVSIYIEGNLLTKLPFSGKQLGSTLDRSFGINQIYDFTNLKNTSKTTIYYLSKYKDYYYYVPVTMINNNKDDKMEIIIKELSSKSVYQTGLISYLKSAKEINYNIENDYLEININENLYNNLNSNNILETVIYSMNLSIKENYNIKEIIYYIDNQQYQKYKL